tara:strand:- start:3799 stop:6246 length:2448 start_codon:yes stop_codon:yes gene_type:complete
METLLEKRNKLEIKHKKYKTKLYSIEDELFDIDMKISTFDNRELLKNVELNNKQQEIIKSDSKNILVVAVPGSGKTHTLINRYIDIVLNKNVEPDSIILITFTKKSGQEMYDRINKYVPNKLPFYVGSLHGLGYKMLNKEDFSILDEKDTRELIIEVAESITDNDYIVKNICNIYEKQSICDKLNLINVLENMDINIKFKSIIEKILKHYGKIKSSQKLLDFNDLMILLNKFLDSNNGILFREKIKYIFFDEFQDINPIQNSILEKFKNNSNIMVVGDDAQSIYSFRGSSVDYILNYKYDDCYYLENNYRSTPYIINFFDDIISNNIKKLNKKILSPKTENGIKPIIRHFDNNSEQFQWVTEQIKEKYNEGIKLKDIAILSRTNSSLTNLELYLKKYEISYNKSSGISILNKQHIKDLLAFISLLYNNKNSVSIKRILKLHKINYSKDVSIELFKYSNTLYEFFTKFINVDDNIKIQLLRKYIENFYPNEVNDIKTTINFLKESNNLKNSFTDLYLNVELENNEDRLLLSTIHSAKGLEWDHVYIIDCSSDTLPCIRPSFYKDEINNYEEERRLFYVSSSRAKKYLHLTYSGEISPFIKELNKDNYISHNINTDDKVKHISNVYDIKNKLKYDGYGFCINKLFNSVYEEYNINNKINLNIECNKYVDTFLLLVIKKILINNYKDVKIKMNQNIDINLLSNFKDSIIDINNSLSTIKIITDNMITYKYKNNDSFKKLIKYDYSYFEKELVKFFGKNKKIIINNDDTIIIDNNFYFIKSSTRNASDVFNVLKAEYLSKSNNFNIYNPFNGILHKINL